MKYTLEEIKIKVLEDIAQRHKDLVEDSKKNINDTSLVVSANDMSSTFQNMDIIFNYLIELEDVK